MRIVCQKTILTKYHALFVCLLQIIDGALRVNIWADGRTEVGESEISAYWFFLFSVSSRAILNLFVAQMLDYLRFWRSQT